MTARGVDFLEDWMNENRAGECRHVGILAVRLLADTAEAGLTMADLELGDFLVEDYIREALTHLAEPGKPGDRKTVCSQR